MCDINTVNTDDNGDGIVNSGTDNRINNDIRINTDSGIDPNNRANDICVDIQNLNVRFPTRSGLMGKISGWTKAVDGISFGIRRGETFSVVGESGCGKTTAAMAVMGLIKPTSGDIRLYLGDYKEKSTQWADLHGGERKRLRRLVQIVFQDPYSSLNPRMTVRSILSEPFAIHNLYGKKEREARIAELLDRVGLSTAYLDRYPHEFSGGQRQRVGIARALATSPEFIVADEPVSALDVSIQAQIINLLQDLQRRYSQTMLFISHDLAVVRHIADRIAVMYRGKIMEMGDNEAIFASHAHPYTELLLKSVPTAGTGTVVTATPKVSTIGDDKDVSTTGNGAGCAFYPRCPRRCDRCVNETPELNDLGSGHFVACFCA
ncbi:MAG: ATP-binding cassette domain-containing protein [Chitinispirillales bacterium]|jgi:oligopeptide/dipeptide ABC transporter ATP-binding protein|nr:ATP-binding cassette domain-containing protein [Chitinispirillales bacterium]